MAEVSKLDQSVFSKEVLFHLLEECSSGIFHWDASHDSVLWSSKLHMALGHPIDTDTAYIDIENLLHPDDRHAMRLAVEESRNTLGEYEMMIRLRSRSGGYKEFQVFGKWLADATNSDTLVGFVIDHTDLNEARTEAERSRQLLENFFETAPAAVYLKDGRYRHKYGNAMAARIAGCTREDFLSKTTFELFGEESAADLASVDDRVIEERETVSWQGPTTSASGESFFIHDTKFPVTDPKTGEVMVGGFGIDISKQHEAEMQLVQSRKLEALGQLVAGIAHDFNNSLMVMQSSLDLLKQSKTLEAAFDCAEELTDGIERGARLTEQLLAFGRQTVLKNEVFTLDDLFGSMEGMLRSTIPENIDLELAFQEGTQAIKADRSQVENMVLNLVLNSIDAMPNGGTLTISSRTASAAMSHGGVEPSSKSEARVQLSVSDTGSGIEPRLLDKVFDPFFTTKDPRRGTGMGLSMVDGLMEQLGGSASIRSTHGVGTTVDLLFPGTSDKVTRSSAPSDERAEGEGQGRSLLVVEDNPSVLRLLSRQLREQGFEVSEAASGADALEKFEADPTISLVVSDIVMPGEIQGVELAKRIRSERPQVPIILMSGYPLDTEVQSGNRLYYDEGLMKPVRASKLLETVQRLLSSN